MSEGESRDELASCRSRVAVNKESRRTVESEETCLTCTEKQMSLFEVTSVTLFLERRKLLTCCEVKQHVESALKTMATLNHDRHLAHGKGICKSDKISIPQEDVGAWQVASLSRRVREGGAGESNDIRPGKC